MTTSGRSSASRSASTAYSDSPLATAARTASSMARPSRPAGSMRLVETTGSERTDRGVSHSWERPTRWSSRPRPATISVALGRSETMRTSREYAAKAGERSRL